MCICVNVSVTGMLIINNYSVQILVKKGSLYMYTGILLYLVIISLAMNAANVNEILFLSWNVNVVCKAWF